jgi:AraC family transcriptional activator of pobA
MLATYFESEVLMTTGLPTVQYVADALHVSFNYLSSMVKVLTSQSTQHVYDKLIEKAKVLLSSTNLSVSEIAYGLGFEHPRSFTQLFNTTLSPLKFRQSSINQR